jgi:hypothetical protein
MPRWQSNVLERAVSAGMSRGQFVRRSVFAVGAVGGLGLMRVRGARGATPADPSPIPGGFDESFKIVSSGAFIHVLPPAIGFEMSTITDFDGVIAAAEIQGTAHGTDGSEYTFDTDMRFMKGRYIGIDGQLRQGSFGFV